MPEPISLETIVAHGLCLGCGICESMAGTSLVEMAITSYGQMRPQVRSEPDDAMMDQIRAVCPGITLTGPDPEQVADKGVMHDIWGPIRTMSRGWSTNEDLRFRSAAGGAMTALGCYLLETGKVDAIQIEIDIAGDMDEETRQRVAEIADMCPVHKTLHGEIRIESRLKNGV